MSKFIIIKSKKLCPLCVLVDDEDYDKLSKFNWRIINQNHTFNKIFYAAYSTIIEGKSKIIFMHRIILGIDERKVYVDHIDGNGLNNQKNNLRKCNHSQNMSNRKSSDKSKSQYLGVWYDKSKNKWVGQSRTNHVKTNKRFNTEIEAALFYNEIALKNKGEFARLNIIK